MSKNFFFIHIQYRLSLDFCLFLCRYCTYSTYIYEICVFVYNNSILHIYIYFIRILYIFPCKFSSLYLTFYMVRRRDVVRRFRSMSVCLVLCISFCKQFGQQFNRFVVFKFLFLLRQIYHIKIAIKVCIYHIFRT